MVRASPEIELQTCYALKVAEAQLAAADQRLAFLAERKRVRSLERTIEQMRVKARSSLEILEPLPMTSLCGVRQALFQLAQIAGIKDYA